MDGGVIQWRDSYQIVKLFTINEDAPIAPTTGELVITLDSIYPDRYIKAEIKIHNGFNFPHKQACHENQNPYKIQQN